MSSTTVRAAVWLPAVVAVTVTRACAAWPSGDVPWSRTSTTSGTWRAGCSTRLIAAWSAAVSGPDARLATMTAVPDAFALPWNGAASRAACTLGADEDRNWELPGWVTLDRLGSSLIPAISPAAHTATMTQRNRTSRSEER